MENQQQESFKLLRTPCVELSSKGLAFRANQASASEVLRALNPLHDALQKLSENNALDEKLAEYAFFPLTHIFNQTQKLPARCVELAIQCLKTLVLHGWRQRLSPELGKQLIILLTLIVGGPQVTEKSQTKTQAPEELSIAGFDCLCVVFNVLDSPLSARTIFHEIGTATVVDQIVYLLLEGIMDDRSQEVSIAAGKALLALLNRVQDRVVLASVMPRTISALAKVVKPTTQTRRPYKLLESCLQALTYLLKNVLSDSVVTEKNAPTSSNPNSLVLDESWLKATTTQIKLALANIIQIRRHQRREVQAALMELCMMIIQHCPVTLKDSVRFMVETVVVLVDADMEDERSKESYQILLYLATTYPEVVYHLGESLHSWLVSFPRYMQSNDETLKQRGIRQISTAYQVISTVQSHPGLLTNELASSLCDSVSAVVKLKANALQPLSSTGLAHLDIEVFGSQSNPSLNFAPILLDHRSDQQTLRDLQSMIVKLNSSESGNAVTRHVVDRVHPKPDESAIGPFWLAVTSLRAQAQSTADFDDFIEADHIEEGFSGLSRAKLIDELYYTSLMILTDPATEESGDWRISALALEAFALQGQQLGEAFRPELMEALYPTLQLLASNNPVLQRHAMTCLNILTRACKYPDTSTMIIENVDYLVNSVSMKLLTFDVSPYPPSVLFMMTKLCGARLIPYLDDVIDAIFGIVDLHHGYPKLTEMLFKALGAIVEEGSKKQSVLTIDEGRESGPQDFRKTQYQPLSMAAVAADIAKRRAKRDEHDREEIETGGSSTHPKKPWSETYGKPTPEPKSIEELLDQAESDEPLPEPTEPEDSEKPLSKTHSLLVHIVKSIPPHLSSPSPNLRRFLLSILINTLPTLSQNENSFLPLINDLWPSVASRINFPSTLGNGPSSTSLVTQPSTRPSLASSQPTNTFQEETFVMITACQVIEAMCKGAGDFMSTRIETEFSRWERLYKRVWTKVSQDAEAANKRRTQKAKVGPVSLIREIALEPEPKDLEPEDELNFSITSSLALSPIQAGSRAFTPEHALWRALVSLFLTVLTRVRVSQDVGDCICEMLGAWISQFIGPAYYSYYSQDSRRSGSTLKTDEAQKDVIDSVEKAIQAMETWNADLTWFIFARERSKMDTSIPKATTSPMTLDVSGERLKFANLAF
ncbi:Armadillo-like helical [Penicillium taxi]|uniref:Armadillo-like helical n=1 Tax=Penicillium taxi TaxID=168475 RepID=UPI00254594FD|nr:Armadillo-like helical [Penicillium taxi]KAJ5888659.1 Armadillo-like helical [Penicillium taxi]